MLVFSVTACVTLCLQMFQKKFLGAIPWTHVGDGHPSLKNPEHRLQLCTTQDVATSAHWDLPTNIGCLWACKMCMKYVAQVSNGHSHTPAFLAALTLCVASNLPLTWPVAQILTLQIAKNNTHSLASYISWLIVYKQTRRQFVWALSPDAYLLCTCTTQVYSC